MMVEQLAQLSSSPEALTFWWCYDLMTGLWALVMCAQLLALLRRVRVRP